jgi:hypothetical protein
VATQPQVAVVVGVGLVRTLVLATVGLDDDATLAPQAVDRPGTHLLVARGKLDPVADEEVAKAPLVAGGEVEKGARDGGGGAGMMRQRQAAVP